MTIDDMLADDDVVRRPLWLMTLADLLLLLVGFFVFLQANRSLDGRAIGQGLRAAFGSTRATPSPMAVDTAAIGGFAAGSAVTTGDPATTLAWARDATRDPRTIITVVGQTDGSAADIDSETGSAAILAGDRARAAARLLASAIAPQRLRIATASGASRTVLLHIGFAGQSTDTRP